MTSRFLAALVASTACVYVSVCAADHSDTEVGADFDAAIAKIRENDATSGITSMRAAVARVAKAAGENTPAHAAALFKLSVVYLAANDFDSAATALKQACQVVTTDKQSAKDRLTYQMNLGEVLIRLNRLDEANKVLRDSLKEREAFYGVHHAGYAYGLQPLAELLLTQKQPAEALPLITTARDICLNSDTPVTPAVFADRAFAVIANSGTEKDAWEKLDTLPAAVRTATYKAIIDKSLSLKGGYVVTTLEALQQRLSADPAAAEPVSQNARIALVNAAQREKDYPRWIKAIDLMIAEAAPRGDPGEIINLLMNKAMACEHLPDESAAAKVYSEALDKARASKVLVLIAQVERNFGLYYSQHKNRTEADSHLAAALEAARTSGDKNQLISALTAYGIFVQHGGDLERGQKLLEEALSGMTPRNPNFLYAQNHLNAIVNKKSCGCGDMSGAISDGIKKLIRERIPEGLIDDIIVSPKADEPVSVKFKRKPTDEQREQVDTVIKQAIVELKKAARSESP
jgi:tetratricopeptide (TPR) repeat protein